MSPAACRHDSGECGGGAARCCSDCGDASLRPPSATPAVDHRRGCRRWATDRFTVSTPSSQPAFTAATSSRRRRQHHAELHDDLTDLPGCALPCATSSSGRRLRCAGYHARRPSCLATTSSASGAPGEPTTDPHARHQFRIGARALTAAAAARAAFQTGRHFTDLVSALARGVIGRSSHRAQPSHTAPTGCP